MFTCTIGACGDTHVPAGPRWVHDVQRIENLPREHRVHVWWDDGEVHAVFVARTDDGVALVVDGTAWSSVPSMPVTWGMAGTDVGGDRYGPAVFIGRGVQVAHTAPAEDGVRYVVNRRPDPVFEEVWPLVFSPDGSRYAYLARRRAQKMVVLDGEVHALVADVERRPWDGWPLLVFSERGAGFGFTEQGLAEDGKKASRTWVGKEPGPWFIRRGWSSLVFSAEGSDHAYIATGPRDRKSRVVRGGSAGPAFNEIRRLAFDPTGERLAYYARGEGLSGLMINNVPQSTGHTDVVGMARFSPDGKRVAYVESAEGGWRLVVDGGAGTTYERVTFVGFAPDGSTPVSIAQVGATMFPVIGTTEGERGTQAWPPTFSPDGTRHAYRILRDRKVMLVLDGEPVAGVPRVAGDASFAPDGGTVAYLARDDAKREMVVIDGEPGPAFVAVEPLEGRLSLTPPDGDAAPITAYSWAPRPAPWSHVHFADPVTAHYVAVREGSYHYVTVRRR